MYVDRAELKEVTRYILLDHQINLCLWDWNQALCSVPVLRVVIELLRLTTTREEAFALRADLMLGIFCFLDIECILNDPRPNETSKLPIQYK